MRLCTGSSPLVLLLLLLPLLLAETACAQQQSLTEAASGGITPVPFDSLLYGKLQRPPHAIYHHTPLGLCEDYPEETTTMETIRKDFELLERSGIKLLRVSFGWDGIEGSKDEYDWLFWDEFVRMAVEDYGITLIPYICYTPNWNSTNKDPNLSWHYPPVDYEEFGEFVHDIVTRYKGYIKSWEIWNEPDIWVYWTGEQEDFAKLFKIGSEAVREADPEATVVLAGLAHDLEWLESLFKNHGISPYADVVNMHNYYETWHRLPLERIDEYIGAIDDIVHRYGDGQPLWMAEVGYSTYRGEGNYVSEVYEAYYDYEHTLDFQAVQLVRTITAALATEKLSALAWYEIKDLPPEEDVIGDEFNNRFLGVALADHTPKPAEQALTFINQFYAEPMRSLDDEVLITRPIDSAAAVYAFEQEDGDVILAGWLRTKIIGEQGTDTSGYAKDTRQETISVTLPANQAGTATLYDELGNTQPFQQVIHQDGQPTVELTMRGGEMYLVYLPKAAAD